MFIMAATSIGRNSFRKILNINRYFNSNRKVATLIDGRKIAKEIQEELKTEIAKWSVKRKPMIVAILIGDDPASATYVAGKMKVADLVGVDSKTELYPETYDEHRLLTRIKHLNEDDSVDGILVQLPLPNHMDEKLVCSSIDYRKDVDGFNALNIGKVALGKEALVPCTPLGVAEMLKRSKIETRGKTAVVIGRSKNVGLPVALLLHANPFDATTMICHRRTPPEVLKSSCLNADILVVATGVPSTITEDMVKPGAVVIDVGITRTTNPETCKSKLIGDVDFENVKNVAGYITPVPGGVGPMTVTMLMYNTFLAAKWRSV